MLNENASLKEVIDAFELINSKLIDRGGSRTILPGYYNQILNKGNYKGDITILGDSNLKPENIKNGISIFNVVGNAISGDGGKKFAAGTLRTSDRKSDLYSESGGIYDKFDNESKNGIGYIASYVGLTFTPRIIILIQAGDLSTLDERACTVYVNDICIMALATCQSYKDTCLPVSVKVGPTYATIQWYVNNRAFQLPCAKKESNYNWYAFE